MNTSAVMVIIEDDRYHQPLSISLECLGLARSIADSLSAPLIVGAVGGNRLAERVAGHNVDRVYRVGGEAP